MSTPSPDRRIDQQLRNVPLPDGLLDRLRLGEILTDQLIDQCLCDVPVSPAMLRRWRDVVQEEQIDRQLCDVPVPSTVLAGCRLDALEPIANQESVVALRPPLARPRRRRSLVQRATAASLTLMLTGLFLAAIGGILAALRLEMQPKDVVDLKPGRAVSPQRREMSWRGRVRLREEIHAIADPAGSPADRPLEDYQVVFLAPLSDVPAGPAGQLAEQISQGLAMNQDVLLLQVGPLGHPDTTDDQQPELEVPLPPPAVGATPPLVRQFDRAFLFNRGVNPIVRPANHPQLAQSVVPLTSTTASFDYALRLASEGRMPEAERIRVEDFLAAMPYRFAKPRRGQLGIRTAAGPSEFGEPLASRPACLLQVGIKAGDIARRKFPVTHLTVALDVSASMRFGDRWQSAREALRGLIDQMERRDRLSLVIYSDQVVRLAEGVDRIAAVQILDLLATQLPTGGTDLSGGLQQAISLAQETSPQRGVARRLVLVSDGRTQLPAETATRLEGLLEQATSRGLSLDVIDLSDSRQADPTLNRLAAAASGRVIPAKTAAAIRSALIEALTGNNPTIAEEARLKITFNPKVVAAYRLLGHEATVLGGELSPVEMQAGQEASAVYELWLHPEIVGGKPASPGDAASGNNRVALVELNWRDMDNNSRRLVQPISRLQFAPTLAERPLSLQAAAIAAESAEILRQSYFCQTKSRNLQQVLRAAERVNPILGKRSEFRRFLRGLEDIHESARRRNNN